MSKIECQCEACGQWFQRVKLRGQERQNIACPKCQSRQVKVADRSPSLFDGISNFSTLAKDTN